jgi:1-acyl-sn-glycerol-3-phosphate acyltransferase
LKEVLVQGSALLAEGAGVVLFPQSTRDAVFDPAAFNTLGVKLGRHAGVPVVPLALRTDFLQNGRWLKDLGRVCPSIPVRVQFGPPLTVSGNGRTAHAEVVRFITARLREWGAQLKRQENPG